MQIGELAHAAQCTVETVRYYEKSGLLPAPARSAGNFRIYGPQHAERLRFIRNCRALDMNHAEIRSLLALAHAPSDDCTAINAVFDDHMAHVDERIRELGELKAQLGQLRDRCRGTRAVDDCGILQGLADMDPDDPPQRHTHLG